MFLFFSVNFILNLRFDITSLSSFENHLRNRLPNPVPNLFSTTATLSPKHQLPFRFNLSQYHGCKSQSKKERKEQPHSGEEKGNQIIYLFRGEKNNLKCDMLTSKKGKL